MRRWIRDRLGTNANAQRRGDAPVDARWCFALAEPIELPTPDESEIARAIAGARLVRATDGFARHYGYRSASDILGSPLARFWGETADPTGLALVRCLLASPGARSEFLTVERDRWGRELLLQNRVGCGVERGALARVHGMQRKLDVHRTGLERALLCFEQTFRRIRRGSRDFIGAETQ